MSLNLTDNAKAVLSKRYLIKNSQGEPVETAEGLFRRVANHIAAGDLAFHYSVSEMDTLAESFFRLMIKTRFLPNSPTLMNAGKPDGQLSACFVLPVPDSLPGIFETLKHAAIIHQSGGGTGFSFSRLRPEGDFLAHTSGVTSGPLSFMDVYNAATEAVKQGGTRRGANMAILRIDHPDIEAFIRVKQDLTRLTNFNLSVAVTDAFMDAVKSGNPFHLLHPKTGETVKTVDAQSLMNEIVQCAWQSGEPGLIFIDRINRDNPTPGIAAIESTNPCGEVPLLPYEACNLGSINLAQCLNRFVDKPAEIDWGLFRQTIHEAVHFLDNVITQNVYPLPEIVEMVQGNRKIGLGLMGWADTLIALGLGYDTDEAIALAHRVSAVMNYESKRASVELAKQRGAFPYFDKSVFTTGDWFTKKFRNDKNTTAYIPLELWTQLDQDIKAFGIRNATTISYAPTGTISMIAGASGGIEPLYALSFTRTVMDKTILTEFHSEFEAVLKAHQLAPQTFSEALSVYGSLRNPEIEKLIPKDFCEEWHRIFVTAHDIAPVWHIRMQAAFQAHSDNAVSKTINFPESATPDLIQEAYELADTLDLKGITVYRNNSRQWQPMSVKTMSAAPEAKNEENARRVTILPDAIPSGFCPDCNKALIRQEGCWQCPDCQYALCG